ncbi:hypothetical protein [Curtobacterium sp. ISL-83]|uniref:hypothetical protein n=1 Tax=Curtobacterium sp. ISL-83 TaxID=2819145 RepID=UPI001BEB6504|nr:hypothetical protein [Curtobacterium sp. ISL-83]MBT2504188.1 hypothetical protein [Curtobacterium sp. ISL-83]
MVAATLERHWSLFEDWCDAFEKPKEPTTPDTLVEFLQAFPAGVTTNTLRVRAVRLHHQEAGVPLDLDGLREAVGGLNVSIPTPTSLVRLGEEYVSPEAAIQQLPKVRHGASVAPILRARRNAFLIVLFAHLGLNRNGVRNVTAADITPVPLTIAGTLIPRGDDPASCFACAVTRWLRVVWPAERGNHAAIRTITDPRAHYADIHDCDEGLDHDWRAATTLLPAIDQHGWVDSHQPISTRTLSNVVGHLQLPTGYREQRWTPTEPKPTRFDGLEDDEFDRQMAQFDIDIARALARTAELLADAQHTSNEVWGLLNSNAG